MIRKIILENYMSHVRTEIEPAAGLTVLLGPNNCGKSAVVSALETLARNATGDFMIRHGEKEARVTVETDDGHTLVWRRKGGKVSYEIDGRPIDRLRRDVPDDLHDHLKMPLIESPRDDEPPFDVHFGQQKSPIFLLDQPEGRAAMFFSASSDAGRMLELQDLHRDKVRDHKTRRRSLAAEVERIARDLVRLAPIDDVEPRLVAIESEFSAIQKLEREILELDKRLVDAERCRTESQKFAARGSALERLEAPPALADTQPLISQIAAMERVSLTSQEMKQLRAALESLRDPPALVDVDPLRKLIDEMDTASRAAGRAVNLQNALARLQEAPAAIDPAPITEAIAALDAAGKKVVVCWQVVSDKSRQLAEVESQIKSWARAHPDCPICGGPVSAEALLEGNHAHDAKDQQRPTVSFGAD